MISSGDSDATGLWAGYIGPDGSAERLMQIVGRGGKVRTGAGWGIGIRPGRAGGETPVLSETAVRIGDSEEAGSSARITLVGGQRPQIETARDPFGVFGVYQARTGDGASWFASHPDPLRRIAGSGIDTAALHGYLCFSHVPAPLTIWSGITEVTAPAPLCPPGDGAPASAACAAARLRGLLREAVARRLGRDRAVGVYLSGGLDSSLVAALLVEAGATPHLFTLDFGPPFDAELPAARAVAAHLGRPLHVVPARPMDIARALRPTARALPQPFGDGVTVPLYLLGRAATQHVAEVWNGEGGDQIFGGWANKPMIAHIAYGDPKEQCEITAYLETYHRFYGVTDRLYTPRMREATAALRAEAWIRPALDRRAAHPTLLHRLRAANIALKGAQNIAPRMNALAQCHGLGLRSPFFDHALAQWTFTLPPDLLLSGACEKYLLKTVAADYLPPGIALREKRGMGVPTTEWCLAPGGLVRREAQRALSPRALRAEGLFDPAFVRRLLDGDDPAAFRRRRIGERTWALLMWEMWRKEHDAR